MTGAASPTPLEVVVAGGGFAAVEATLALHVLAGEKVHVTMLSPTEDLVYRPLAVAEPFSGPARAHYPLADICAEVGAELVLDTLATVDAGAGVVHTGGGAVIPYDALVVAVGARARPALEHAHTFMADHEPGQMHELVRDIEEGYTRRIAFVVPPGAGWSLPLYELALMTAADVSSMDMDPVLTFVTPESAPLAIFKGEGSRAVAALLANAGIDVITGAHVTGYDGAKLTMGPRRRELEVDRVIALPEQRGPLVRGLPVDANAFIPVELDGRVRGHEHVYAIGDATTFPIKQGGIATQQADEIAASIAERAGVDVGAHRFHPVLRAKLLTGGDPLYLWAHIVGGESVSSVAADEPLWQPPEKVAGRILANYLAGRGIEFLEDVEPVPVNQSARRGLVST